MSTRLLEDEKVSTLRAGLKRAQHHFEKQSQRLNDLAHELAEAGLARDKALYYLLLFCDAAEREHWSLSAEMREVRESALNLLFEHNIFVGLSEPDNAILRLMEIVALDQEGASSE